MVRKKTIILLALLLAILIGGIGGVYVFKSPERVIEHDLSHFFKNESTSYTYPDSVIHFLNYHTINNLQRPSVTYKTINSNSNSKEVLASFEIIIYDDINQITDIKSGALIFRMTRNNITWKIESAEIIRNME